MAQILHSFPTEEEIQRVRSIVGTSEEKINAAVENVLAWLSQQPHLPHNMDKRRIENTYINNKCSIERTKQSIDAYFSLKHKFPEYFMNLDPLNKDIQENFKYRKMFPTPRLTKDGDRILAMCDVGDTAIFKLVPDTKVIIMTAELGLLEDYRSGVIIIIDLKSINMSHVTVYPPNQILKLELFLRTAYSNRIKAIHFINASSVMEIILNLIKPVLSAKLYERIHIHVKNSSTLWDFVQKDCVPNEMGGTGGPVDEIYGSWKLFMVQHRDWFLEQDNYLSDESKRLGKFPLGDLHGLDGTFTKLNVD